MDRLEKKVDVIQEQVAMSAENIQAMLKKQGKQGNVIEVLSLRSIHQEAEIRQVKIQTETSNQAQDQVQTEVEAQIKQNQ